ncbi:purple acid phosphatase family protein [Pseudaestuariivita rosea]|uniref:purple acid phosphatase family protein n=1 Tax=Pseudaestuariivita rosea TaxID=2763263 RepID=UPI001ABA31B6|nr:metallophosphoesterase family protein [Pseudaestuariivita rosea]
MTFISPLRRVLVLAGLSVTAALPGFADPILEATIDLRARLVQDLGPEGVVDMAPGTVEANLTDAERDLFSTGYITFTVDQPVTVHIYRDDRLARVDEPFWLDDQGFQLTEYSAEAYGKDFDVWAKDFPAGQIGLGIHAFRVVREHYFISVAPQQGDDPVTITDLMPQALQTETVELGARTYVDRSVTLDAVSDALLGHTLIKTQSDRRPVAAVYRYFRLTDHPAAPRPDQIILTMTDDPSSSMAVQWRTDTSVTASEIALWPEEDYLRPDRPEPKVILADTVVAPSERTVNQPAVHRHSVLLTGLMPDTPYIYAVRPAEGIWSATARFTTAPAGDAPVSFMYFGDVQEGFDRFESVLDQAMRTRPDVDFIAIAGDLVSRGGDADNWDDFLNVISPVARSIPLVPAVGNHELQTGKSVDYYRSLFRLPENGPKGIEPERAYSFGYGGVNFIVMDSNLGADSQTDWLRQTLAGKDDDFTFVMLHHAAFTSRPGRYYEKVTEVWAPVIEDSEKVAMVLQGHDHAYLRTPPMRGGQPDPEGQGPYYVISSAGEKFYDQDDHAYIDVGITRTQMYQVIDVLRDDDRMVYRAFDVYGDERDRVVIDRD